MQSVHTENIIIPCDHNKDQLREKGLMVQRFNNTSYRLIKQAMFYIWKVCRKIIAVCVCMIKSARLSENHKPG